MVSRNIGNLQQLPAQKLTGAAGRQVVRIAGDDQPVHIMPVGQRKKQPAGMSGIVMPPKGFIDPVADVSAVIKKGIMPQPQVASAYRHAIALLADVKEIGGVLIDPGTSGNRPPQTEKDHPVIQVTGIQKPYSVS